MCYNSIELKYYFSSIYVIYKINRQRKILNCYLYETQKLQGGLINE